MKALITGGSGQLGVSLQRELAGRGAEYLACSSAMLDVRDREAVASAVRDYAPDVIFHCGAYTAVDKAESERALCMAVNAEGTRHVAEAARDAGAKLIYLSTDYVFPGVGTHSMDIDEPTGPLNVYGESKLAGEEAVRSLWERSFIVRTSWVFSAHGKNFVRTMLRLGRERDTVSVVSDQIGSPTCAEDLAPLLCDMAETEKFGVYHATNEGFCSWAEFTAEIFRQSGLNCRIQPVSTEEYGAPAPRPRNSRLSKASLERGGFLPPVSWENALSRCLFELSKGE